MARVVTETVHFNVNIRHLEKDGKHIAHTIETGIVTVGETQQIATEAAARWNTFVVAEAKQNGLRALRQFMDARGITYQLDSADSGRLRAWLLSTFPLFELARWRRSIRGRGQHSRC